MFKVLKINIKNGFSLVEMMMLLLISTLILVATLPAITRLNFEMPFKLKHGAYACYYNDEGKLIQEYYTRFARKSSEDLTTTGYCTFKPPKVATTFKVEVVGGGAGGSYSYGNNDVNSFDGETISKDQAGRSEVIDTTTTFPSVVNTVGSETGGATNVLTAQKWIYPSLSYLKDYFMVPESYITSNWKSKEFKAYGIIGAAGNGKDYTAPAASSTTDCYKIEKGKFTTAPLESGVCGGISGNLYTEGTIKYGKAGTVGSCGSPLQVSEVLPGDKFKIETSPYEPNHAYYYPGYSTILKHSTLVNGVFSETPYDNYAGADATASSGGATEVTSGVTDGSCSGNTDVIPKLTLKNQITKVKAYYGLPGGAGQYIVQNMPLATDTSITITPGKGGSAGHGSEAGGVMNEVFAAQNGEKTTFGGTMIVAEGGTAQSFGRYYETYPLVNTIASDDEIFTKDEGVYYFIAKAVLGAKTGIASALKFYSTALSPAARNLLNAAENFGKGGDGAYQKDACIYGTILQTMSWDGEAESNVRAGGTGTNPTGCDNVFVQATKGGSGAVYISW